MQLAALLVHTLQLRLPDEQQARERRASTPCRDGVLKPAQRHPHERGHEHRRRGRDRPCQRHGRSPYAQPGEEPVDEFVLCDFVPRIEDGPRLGEAVRGVERGREDGQPEEEARERDRREADGPGKAHGEAREDGAPREGPPDAVVLDDVLGKLVLVCFEAGLHGADVALLRGLEGLEERAREADVVAESHHRAEGRIHAGREFCCADEVPRRRVECAAAYFVVKFGCDCANMVKVDRLQ